MATPESKTKDRIKVVLKKHGGWWNMPVQSGYGATTLDFICAHPITKELFLIEAKAHREKMTERQVAMTADARRKGHKVFVIDDQFAGCDCRFGSISMLDSFLTDALVPDTRLAEGITE